MTAWLIDDVISFSGLIHEDVRPTRAYVILAILSTRRREAPVTDRLSASPVQGQSRFIGRVSRQDIVAIIIVAVVLAAGAGLWARSLSGFDMSRVNELGLVSVAPPGTLAGLALIALGFVLSLRLRTLGTALAAASVLLLLVAVHGLPSIIEDAPRQSVAYLHAGFTDEIERTGQLLTNVDARFSWPVFFSLGALVTSVAGIGNAIELQAWAAPALNIVYLVPLYAIFSALSLDKRLVWTAMFIFIATNWIGQDYYSPQGFNYLLYLTILAILLRWFRRREVILPIRRIVEFVERRWPSLRVVTTTEDGPPLDQARLSRPQHAALAILVVLLMGVSVASHQLTPFAILASLIALTVLRRTSLVGLPVLLAVLIGMWISYMTVAFLQGHLAGLVADVGAVAGSATRNVTQRLTGNPGHQFVVQVRLVMTGLLWLLAVAGGLRRFRHGHLDIEAAGLAIVPFGLMALQAYGGEMLLRVYLFSLPFVAYLTAGLFFPVAEWRFSSRATRALALMVGVFVLASMLTKHGNEKADWVSSAELAAVDYLHAIAPVGSTFGMVNDASPLRYQRFEMYHYVALHYLYLFDEPKYVARALKKFENCAYVFVSRMQQATAEMYDGLPAGYWEAAKERMVASGQFSVIYQNQDATILALEPRDSSCGGVAQR